ncbi:hypothetical protein [Novosphingobium jiangmenense]|uniref:Uncharacterized protein n=1 Tax=Novosphingobium jiangmenense TaxID=2791981 RepID=A0ABS0HET0_9SPHN|nr:hypothetical protein [Novosphingobium jiangmenense]MBF9150743.1 hypothetical protein [Novosphingobium jiangmenense]
MTATKRKQKPITAHPMFPVVTALWFAAFLGLGSFAVAPSLLEGPVVALGIPAVLPAAAPPLGFTARVLLALVMLLTGAVIGFVVGRRLAPREAAAPRRRDMGATSRSRPVAQPETVEARKPLNPREDLGEPIGGIDDDAEVPSRRRALSLNDEGRLMVPSEEAPLPGFLPWERDEAAPAAEAHKPGPLGSADPLAMKGLFDAADSASQAVLSQTVLVPAPPPAAPFAQADAVPESPAAEIAPEAPVEPQPQAQPAVSAPRQTLHQAPADDVTPLERAPLDALGMVQLIERLALAISRHAAPTRDLAPLEASSFVAPSARFSAQAVSAPIRPASEDAAVAPAPAQMQPDRVVPIRPAAFEPPLVDHAVEQADADEIDEAAAPPRFLKSAGPVAELGASEQQATAEPEVAEERYPSLLDMQPTSLRPAFRIDDGLGLGSDAGGDVEDSLEPVVVFPGQGSVLQAPRHFERPTIQQLPGSPLAAPGRAAPSSPTEAMPPATAAVPGALPDPEEADRALRAALATLQRMTAQG